MKTPMIIVGAVLGLGALVFGTLIFTGVIKLNPKPIAKPIVHSKTDKLVPLTFKELPAGTRITKEILTNPRTGQINGKWVDMADYKKTHTSPPPFMYVFNDLDGRVLNHDLHPGNYFTEDDFLPKGTEGDGIPTLIPAGYRGITFADLKKLDGARTLKFKDHIDLVASQKIDVGRNAAPDGSRKTLSDYYNFKTSIGVVGVVARDAVVITPVSTVTTVTGSSASGKLKTKPSEQIIIAIKVDDTPAVISLLASGADLWCLPHSALPKGASQPLEVTSFAQATNHTEGPKIVDIIKGGKHHSQIMTPDTQPTGSDNAPYLVPVGLMNRPGPTAEPAASPTTSPPAAGPAAPVAVPAAAPTTKPAEDKPAISF